MIEAGLPVGWSLPRLDQIARVTSGKRLPKGRGVTALPTPHPYIRVTDMRMGKVDLSNVHYVPEDVAPKIARYTVDAGDIYISCAGTLGIVGLVPEVLNGANLTENANRISGIQIDRHYLLHVLMSEAIQGHIQNIQTVGAQPKLALGRIRSFAIPCPDDRKEQEAIAEALSDADALIEGLERLIAKKRLIKQGAMQDLLTAKRRLPGFSGEWSVSQVGSKVRMQVGFPFPSAGFSKREAGPRLIRNRDLRSDSDQVFFSGEYSDAYLVKPGEVLIGMDGDFAPTIWKGGRALLNQRVGRLSPLGDNQIAFFHYCLQAELSRIEAATSGTTVKHLSHRDVDKIEIPIPDPDEQGAIAGALLDMDAEIQALETRLEKARQVKEGMMQNLLTGRIRLV
jgi:type I restriction enzyme S subunit